MGEARKDFWLAAKQILAETVRDAHPIAAFTKLPIGAAAEARDFLQQQQAVAQGGCEAVYGGALVFQVLREDIVAAHLAPQVFLVSRAAPKVDELLAGTALEKAVQIVLTFDYLVCTRKQMVVLIRTALESCFEKQEFGFYLTDVAPIHGIRLRHEVKSGAAGAIAGELPKHCRRAGIYMQIDVVALIVQLLQQGGEHSRLVVGNDEKCVFHRSFALSFSRKSRRRVSS